MSTSKPQLTLVGLARFLAALSTGALPSQTQVSAFLTALVESPLFSASATSADVIGEDGEALLDALRGLVIAVRDLGDAKNGDDLLQNFLHLTSRSAAAGVPRGAAAGSDLPVSPGEDVTAVASAARTVASLALTSGAFRRVLSEAADVFGALLLGIQRTTAASVEAAKGKPGVAEASEAAKRTAKEGARQWWDEHGEVDPRDVLVERIQALVEEVQADDRFKEAAEAAIQVVRRYIDSALIVTEMVEDEGKRQKDVWGEVSDALAQLVGRFIGEEEVGRLGRDMRGVIRSAQADKQLRVLVGEAFQTFERLFQDPHYASSPRFPRRLRYLSDSLAPAVSRQSGAFRSSLQSLFGSFASAGYKFEADPHVQKVASAASEVAAVGVKGAVADATDVALWEARAWVQLGKVLAARVWSLVRSIAVPRIEFVTEDWDFAVDGINLDGPVDGGDPMIRWTAVSSTTASYKHGTVVAAATHVSASGFRFAANNVSFYVKKKNGNWLSGGGSELDGRMDLVFGFGDREGFGCEVELGRPEGGVQRGFYEVLECEAKVQGFSMYLHQTNHPLITYLLKPPLETFIASNLHAVLSEKLHAGLEAVDSALFGVWQSVRDARSLAEAAHRLLTRVKERVEGKTHQAQNGGGGNGAEANSRGGERAEVRLGKAGVVKVAPSYELAVGFGAQLLPGKAAPPLSRRSDAARELSGAAQQGRRRAEQGVREATEAAGRIGEAVGEARDVREAETGREGWRSDAFDI